MANGTRVAQPHMRLSHVHWMCISSNLQQVSTEHRFGASRRLLHHPCPVAMLCTGYTAEPVTSKEWHIPAALAEYIQYRSRRMWARQDEGHGIEKLWWTSDLWSYVFLIKSFHSRFFNSLPLLPSTEEEDRRYLNFRLAIYRFKINYRCLRPSSVAMTWRTGYDSSLQILQN